MASHIGRRKFLATLGGAAAWPITARAQQRPLPVIGLLSSRSPATDAPLVAIMREGIKETGLVEGQNFTIDYRSAEGRYDRLASLAADLVHRQVALIVTIGGEVAALAAKAATMSIPIVFGGGTDPVRSGIVTSLHRPGGNITGVSAFQIELEPKKLELLRELHPTGERIAVLINPSTAFFEMQVNDIKAAAHSVAQHLDLLQASTSREIDAAFQQLAKMHAEALLVATDPFFFTRAAQLVVLTARHAIPTLYFRREFVAIGGLISYGSNGEDTYRALAFTLGAFSRAKSQLIYRSSYQPSSS